MVLCQKIYQHQVKVQNKRKLLEDNGKISHREAVEKAEKEFEIYREKEMKQLESDFDKMLNESNK